MKILYVTEYFPPKIFGGGEISAYNIAKTMAEYYDVTVLTSQFSGLLNEEKKDNFTILRKLKTGENPHSLKENFKRKGFIKNLKETLLNLQKKEKYDIIHFLNTTSIPNFKLDTVTFATINSYTNFCPKGNYFFKEEKVCDGCNPKKFIECINNSEYVGKQKLNWFLKYNPLFLKEIYKQYTQLNHNLQNIDYFFARSNFIKNLLIKSQVNENSIAVIPGLMEFKKQTKQFELKKDQINFTYIGVIEKFKGVELLIDIFNKLPKANLHIFGEGSLLKELEKKAKDNIYFHGSVDYSYIPSINKQSDVIISPSQWPEPLSRVMLEGMFFGKPLIVSDRGGNIDLVDKNGFICKSKKDIKEAINKLIENPQLRNEMGLASEKKYHNQFRKDKIVKEIIKAYETVKRKN